MPDVDQIEMSCFSGDRLEEQTAWEMALDRLSLGGTIFLLRVFPIAWPQVKEMRKYIFTSPICFFLIIVDWHLFPNKVRCPIKMHNCPSWACGSLASACAAFTDLKRSASSFGLAHFHPLGPPGHSNSVSGTKLAAHCSPSPYARMSWWTGSCDQWPCCDLFRLSSWQKAPLWPATSLLCCLTDLQTHQPASYGKHTNEPQIF